MRSGAMRKTKETNGLQFTLQPPPPARRSDFFGRLALGLAVLLSVLGCLNNGLNLSGAQYFAAIPLLTGAAYCLLYCELSQNRKPARYIALIVLAIYAVALNKWIVDGWNITMNQVFAGLEGKLGRIFPRYAVEARESLRPLCVTLFLALPAAIIGLAAGRAANGKAAAPLVFVALLAAAAIAGVYTPDAWTALLLIITAAVCIRGVMHKNSFSDKGGMILWLPIVLAPPVVIAVLLSLAIGANTDGAEADRREAARRINSMRYGLAEQILPSGDFSALKPFVPEADKPLMSVTLTSPMSLYFRGFVGERYVESGWAELPAAKKAASAKDFSWLHSRGFYGQNQLALLADALNMESAVARVSVANGFAGSGVRYAPYELKTGGPDASKIGDADLPADGFRGERRYDYYITDRSVEDHEELYARLTDAWRAEDAAALEYLQSENVYRDYVYANYLDVPEKAAAAIRSLLGDWIVPEDGLSFAAAQKTVQSYLGASLTYNETPKEYESGDFLTFLLNESREGSSVHYATAAALLFRSFGIPARYVEGYYVAPEDALLAVEAGNPVVVSEINAHAWVEIYRDGVGFVSFEPVPDNISPTQTRQSANSSGGAADEEPPPAEPANILVVLLWIVSSLLVLLLLLFLLLALRRALRRKRWRRLLEDCGHGEAVELLTAHSVRLLGYMGAAHENGSLRRLKARIAELFGQETSDAFVGVVEIQQRARFSASPVEERQRGVVSEFAASIEPLVKKQCKWTVRFGLRYFKCII